MTRANRRILRPRVVPRDVEDQAVEDDADAQLVRRPSGPHVFDWCRPWHPKSQHAQCPGSYVNHRKEVVVCECPSCNHEDNPNPSLF